MGPTLFVQRRSTESEGSARRIRTDISTLVGAGVLPLDERRKERLRADLGPLPDLAGGSGPSYFGPR